MCEAHVVSLPHIQLNGVSGVYYSRRSVYNGIGDLPTHRMIKNAKS